MSRRPRAAGPRLSMTAMTTRYISLGLCSVTLRACSIEEVVAIAAGAGLECIEWGADVHVPPGDLEAARTGAGGDRAGRPAGGVVRVLLALRGPVRTGARERARARRAARADLGRRHRLARGHAGAARRDRGGRARGGARRFPWGSSSTAARSPTTSTPRSPSSPARGCRATGSRRRTCPTRRRWTGCAGSRTCPPCTSSRGGPGSTRLRLRERAELWRAVFGTFTAGDALLEFVPGDDPALVAEEAEACRALLS